MRVIDYNLEDDELEDVLNDNHIQGLSYASVERHKGRIELYVLSDKWTEDSFNLCKEICRDFGYYDEDSIIVYGSED